MYISDDTLTFGLKQFFTCFINKPAAQAEGADPSRCNSTKSQNPSSKIAVTFNQEILEI